MIIDAIFTAISAVIGVLFNALPTFSLSSSIGLPTAGCGGGCNSLGWRAGSYVGGFDVFFPFHEVASFVQVVALAMLGFYVTYKVANWIWRHVPDIGGFGPGSG